MRAETLIRPTKDMLIPFRGVEQGEAMRKRTVAQLAEFDTLYSLGEQLGISSTMFATGGLVYPSLRWARPHEDVDIIIQGQEEFLAYEHELQKLGYMPKQSLPLRGSSLFHFTHDHVDQVGELSVRYVRKRVSHGVTVWEHDVPFWAHAILGKPLAIPASAFSAPDELITMGETQTRFVYPELAAMIKGTSHYAKDIFDAQLLVGQIDPAKMGLIARDAETAGIIYELPQGLMRLVRMGDKSPLVERV